MKKDIIIQSIDYILQHLDEGISVKDVADHFYFSEFYFSRAFKAVTGESVYAFIKRLKMDQSAVDIKLKKQRSITDIGLDYGYSSSNYSSVFRQHHGLSPAEFRKSTDVTSISNPFQPEKLDYFDTYDEYAARIKIEIIEDMPVIYEKIIGNYNDLKEIWFRFIDKYKDYIKDDTVTLERYYDDPVIASLSSCLCDLCITADGNCKLENMTIIKGGKFAVCRYEGEIQDIFRTVQGIFCVWLPKSGYEMDKRYGVNIYRKMGKDWVVMDICIPIK